MIDYYLTFPDINAFQSVMWEPNEEGNYSNEDATVDVIGIIYRNTGTEDNPVIVAGDGFHVNIRTNIVLNHDLEKYTIVKPEHPKRMFA